MKRLIILGAVWAIAVAKPGLYKEKEDFQFARSSTDEGSKSGYYGAQRGNMGGNFERAHNMDSLAQNQMSGLVRQVEGELGDGANTKTGSVYTAANSRGTYGSGHLDLSNLAGRNFQEGQSYDDSQSQSSQSTAYNQAGYRSSHSQSSRQGGYQAAGHSHSGVNLQADNLQSLDNTQGASQYDYGRQSSQSRSSGFHSQSGYQEHNAYDLSNANSHSGNYGSNVRTRLISATPVRVVVRPGATVAIPVAAQTYDMTHGTSSVDQNSLNSEAEVLGNENHRYAYRPSNAKHYESSYNYRKEWEKHDTIPSVHVTIPTENPFPKNSELYEDDSQRAHSSHSYGGYNANVKSSQSQLNYDTQNQRASSDSNSNAYTLAGYNAGSNQRGVSSDSSLSYIQSQRNAGSRHHGATADSLTQTGHTAGINADLNSQVENLNGKPKSYQSSYSYHKSWERQGDPYVIKPASSINYDGQSSQRLTDFTNNQDYAAFGSHHQHSHQSEADCDEYGHRRVARSAEHMRQIRQHSQNLENLDQQVEDFGQEAQNSWDQHEALQQSQHLNQQNQNIEDLGQQVEDLGQQAQINWDQQSVQQSQNSWDTLEDLGQQTQNSWDTFQGQNLQNQQGFTQENLDQNNKVDNLEQQTQNELGQHIQGTETELGSKLQGVSEKPQDKMVFSSTGPLDLDKDDKQTHNEASEQFKHISEQNKSEKPNEMNTWDKFDHETHSIERQFTQQNKFKNEHANYNVHWAAFPQNSEMERNTGYTSTNNGYFGSQSYNRQIQLQKEENFQHEAHKFYGSNNWNMYSSNQKQDQNTNAEGYSHVNAFETISTNTPPLLNLWNKLDNLEQQSTLLKDISNEYSQEGNNFSKVDSISKNTQDKNNTENILKQQNNYSYGYIQPLQPEVDKEITSATNKSEDIQSASSDNTERLQDVGRGDIGFEDIPDNSAENKPYGKPFDATSNTEVTQNSSLDNTTEGKKELSVLSLNEQKLEDNRNKEKYNISNSNATETQNLQLNNHSVGLYEPQNKYKEQKDMHVSEKKEELEHHYFRGQENSEQNNKKNVSFQQQNEKFFGQHENVEHPILQDFGQHENKEQHNLQSFGQRDNLEQQNIQDFGQHENVEQQNTQDFGPNASVGQQNIQTFGQHEKVEQQNLQNFGQLNNLGHQNIQDFGQHENVGQQTIQDFGQYEQHETVEQQNLQDFGQHENVEQQNLQDFGHENVEQQNLQDFGQHENVEQQNLQDFGQHENVEQQNLQDFGQHENVEQQNLQDFGQHENVEQQNLQDFGHENVEQQNLQDFGQHENVDQQNLQDFGQHENVEQQNLQDFGQHENVEQQNLQDFGQHVNVEQQNRQDFGQHENMDQQNLQDFGQHENDEQQNEQDFGQNENMEQQNLQEFGQLDKLGQQTVPDLGQREKAGQEDIQNFALHEYQKEQQNLQDFRQYDSVQQNAKHQQKDDSFDKHTAVGQGRENLDQLHNFEQSMQHPEEILIYSDSKDIKKSGTNNLMHPGEINEPIEMQKPVNELQSVLPQHPDDAVVHTTTETVTEKPGFWKSIGNKLNRAKSKVASWFQS